ncbi:MAG: hypothetical protein RLZ37_2050 [Actinomycetota bacterium]
MPRFEPFRALRYAPDLVSRVTAPPYDVLSPSDRDALARRHPDNIVHIDLPLESDGPARYTMAAERLASWRSKGVLMIDETPSLTVYRMKFIDGRGRSRSTSGVIGALEVVDENAGGVLPHERTTPKAKTDRLDLTRATECNLSPVWGLSLGTGLTAALSEAGEPMGSVDVDGVVHSFERISDPFRIAHICDAISIHDVVIADGHHRYAISRTYRDELRSIGSPIASGAGLTMTYVAELVEDQLSVAAIHRLYDVPDMKAFESALREHFDILDCPPVTAKITDWMDSNDCLVFLRPDHDPVALRPRDASFTGVRDLDGSRLEHALRACNHEVRYQHGVEEISGFIRSRAADAAVLIRPVTVEEIRRTAREHELMPPKSTFFTPKILTGVALRPLSH